MHDYDDISIKLHFLWINKHGLGSRKQCATTKQCINTRFHPDMIKWQTFPMCTDDRVSFTVSLYHKRLALPNKCTSPLPWISQTTNWCFLWAMIKRNKLEHLQQFSFSLPKLEFLQKAVVYTFIFEARTRSIWKITKSEKFSSSIQEMNSSQFRSK